MYTIFRSFFGSFLFSLVSLTWATLSEANPSLGHSEMIMPAPHGSFILQRSSSMSTRLHLFLRNTTWGSDQVKYRVKGIGSSVYTFENQTVEYYSLLKPVRSQRVYGTYTLFPKILKFGSQEVAAFYGSGFAVDPRLGRRGLGKAILQQSLKASRAALHARGVKIPRLDYAYVEASNTPSYRAFVRSGYQSLGQFNVLTFSRTFTHSDIRVRGLTLAEKDPMVHLLNDFYRDYTLTDFESSVIPHYYHVIKDAQGVVLAGAQVTALHWYLEKLIGVNGWIALNIAPWVPLLNRQVRRDMHILRFGNLYVRSGYENHLAALMSHLLEFHQINTGTISLDLRGKLAPILRQNGLGLLNSLAGETPVEMMVYQNGLDPVIRARILEGPMLYSMSDR